MLAEATDKDGKSSQPTYEELKPVNDSEFDQLASGSQPTYEELKRLCAR